MKCLQCDKSNAENKIKNTLGIYDGLYICNKCLDYNESRLSYDDFN